MPAGPGESLLITCFADVHYYFNDPALRPPHHRFDKGSYVYLFYNPAQRQTKLEIANHAGTPDQDAFHGYLNVANVRHSHLQPNLITLLVNTSAVTDQSTWHLPAFDQRNDSKYMYKLHALDVYLWTEKDASNLLNQLKNVLSSDRLDIKDAQGVSTPHSEHRDSMSPVVQQLERTAIGSQFPPRAASAVSAQSIPGPPTPAISAGTSPKATPMGYNPAAPAAPEPVSYREKTPPPPDDGSGTGLKDHGRYDGAPLAQYPSAAGQHQSYFSGPPQHSSNPSQTSLPGPPGSAPPQKRAPSFGPMAQSTLPQSPPPQQQSFQRQSSYGPTPTQYANYNPQTQSNNYPGSPGYNSNLPPTPSAPPAYSGPNPLQSPGIPPPPPPPQQQPTPIGGYSNYSYNSAQELHSDSLNAHGAYTGDIHNQAYRPTEAEANTHGHHAHKPKNTGHGDGKPSKLQEGVGKVEGKVGRYLNKFDKLW
ncbi:hypothetical protein PRZ48_000692 [Zasmidium cellare]|uniref:RNA recognition motif-containing protein n=1 Tax=Zasmidium cellare TaxID=395010 RepID=A0ABR0EZ69_ZASCE|nr:hypothetical protein PRZ48_000692 [Zasmidium cellare]